MRVGRLAGASQNAIDKNKLALWFGRPPDYQILVEEPLRRQARARRLIAYFHGPDADFDLKKLPLGHSPVARP